VENIWPGMAKARVSFDVAYYSGDRSKIGKQGKNEQA
jgi:hypothetical protein